LPLVRDIDVTHRAKVSFPASILHRRSPSLTADLRSLPPAFEPRVLFLHPNEQNAQLPRVRILLQNIRPQRLVCCREAQGQTLTVQFKRRKFPNGL
jgi:hypothetical protein